ncbi:MAG: Flp family type IVb pilin [Bacilli bacterium]|jgi:Flp pilus assembly pilin Flp
MKFLSRKGQALMEYVLIISLIAVIAIGAVRILGGYLKDAITKASCPMVDKTFIEGDSPGKGYCGDPIELWKND